MERSKSIEVRQGSKTTIVFNVDNVEDIISLTSSCGCTSPDIVDGKVKVEYKAAKVPTHLKHQGYSLVSQYIYIKYRTLSAETLTINIKITT